MSPERLAEELLVAAVERPATAWLLAERAAARLDPREVAEVLGVLADLCAEALEQVAELRGIDVGKAVADLLSPPS
ncbi:hypothetical protein BJF78_24765 [Pseudonocardia sp. CNS-139]|nr:hypothetical protein BJF78_24765 [Pseudonocardia sp. CNS-139]